MALFDKKLSDDLMSLQSNGDESHLDTADNEEAARVMAEGFYENEELYILASQTTKQPFVVCDEDTYEDEIFVFTGEDILQDYAKMYTKDKYALYAMKIPKENIPVFLNTVFAIGADTIMFSDGGAPVRISIEDLAEGPNYHKTPNEKILPANPSVQLPAIYFLQELRRPMGERTHQEMARLRELEEEMVVNMSRSEFIVLFDAGSRPAAPGNKRNMRIPYIKAKNGDVLQPVFTDYMEVQKFNANVKMKNISLTTVSYDQLQNFLGKAAKAFVINPAGFNLILTKEQLKKMKEMYIQEDE